MVAGWWVLDRRRKWRGNERNRGKRKKMEREKRERKGKENLMVLSFSKFEFIVFLDFRKEISFFLILSRVFDF